MAKHPLTNLLRRAYRIASIAAAAQCSLDEAAGRWMDSLSQGQLSRRQMLGGMTLASAAIVNPLGQGRLAKTHLSGVTDRFTDSRVLVVGAGIAGLTVAYRLHQVGVPVDVVEASPRVGGRLRSVSKLAGNLAGNLPGDMTGNLSVVELGGEFIDTDHTAVRSLAAELGLEMADLRAADEGLEPEILYFQGRKISHSWVAEAFSPLAQRIAKDIEILSGWNLTYHDANPDAVRFDRLSLAEYLSLTPVHPIIEQLVRVAYITEYGLDADTQSCLNLLFLIGAEAGKWSTYGVSDERYHVVGGNDLIPRRLAERLDGRIELNTSLESIRKTANDRYRVSLRSGSTSTERVYDRIVLAIPFTVLRQVELAVDLPPVKRAAITELGYGTSSKLAIPFQERIWRTRYGSTITIYTDMEFQNTWESARYAAGPAGWLTDLRGGRAGLALENGSPEEQAKSLLNDLDSIFPGIGEVDRGTALRAVWASYPYALGSYACYLPGQWTKFGGAEVERVGNIWFAGEHCSVGSQGYMNGACETAEQAAQQILAELGVESRKVAGQTSRQMVS
ncbi:monoamine oxidase [filamentous cyanobacterium CCP2]|nr:monoamine oxidase [filamentous cyanobacterium CCP2]